VFPIFRCIDLGYIETCGKGASRLDWPREKEPDDEPMYLFTFVSSSFSHIGCGGEDALVGDFFCRSSDYVSLRYEEQ
jgi:hypothetical protein